MHPQWAHLETHSQSAFLQFSAVFLLAQPLYSFYFTLPLQLSVCQRSHCFYRIFFKEVTTTSRWMEGDCMSLLTYWILLGTSYQLTVQVIRYNLLSLRLGLNSPHRVYSCFSHLKKNLFDLPSLISYCHNNSYPTFPSVLCPTISDLSWYVLGGYPTNGWRLKRAWITLINAQSSWKHLGRVL